MWTKEKTERLQELIAAKVPRPQIAAELGMSPSTVSSKVKRLRYEERYGKPLSRRAVWTEEASEQLKVMFFAGVSYSDMAKAFNRRRTPIYERLERMGCLPDNPERVRAVEALAKANREAVHQRRIERAKAYRERKNAEKANTPAVKRKAPPSKPATQKKVPPPPPITFDEAVAHAKPWLERRTGFECAFPVSGAGSDTMSCCAPVPEGHTYCSAHRSIMFVPTPKIDPRRWTKARKVSVY